MSQLSFFYRVGMRLLLALVLLAGRSASAQQFFPPNLGDNKPAGGDPHTGVLHTGTDASQAAQLQVMTWDNDQDQVYFSWVSLPGGNFAPTDRVRVDPPPGFNRTTTKLSDPDIIVGRSANYPDSVFVQLVYLVEDKQANPVALPQVYWDVYYRTGGSGLFTQKRGFPKPMGSFGTYNLQHASPNIDVNLQGQVAMVWQELSYEQATITITSPHSFPNGYTYPVPELAFSQCFAHFANINGESGCPNQQGVSILNANNSPTSTPVAFNQMLRPDVALGASPNVVSFSYLNSYAVPGASPVEASFALVVKQYTFDVCTLSYLDEYSWTDGVGPANSYPRIAADSYKPHDVEVVLAWHSGDCVPDHGPVSYAEIHNFGKRDYRWGPTYTLVSQPSEKGINSLPADEPVVSFLPNREDHTFVVAWTGTDYDAVNGNGKQRDVWARTFDEYNAPLTRPLTPNYSRINDKFDGAQYAPSIAGRYAADPRMTYFLADAERQRVVFKQSSSLPGDGNLSRPANTNGGGQVPENQPKAKAARAFPNPFAQTVTVELHLQAQEQVAQLLITDLSGRVVGTLPAPPVAAEATTRSLTWPAKNLPTGSYLLRLQTNQRNETIPLSKQ